jgi:hypothetical protein
MTDVSKIILSMTMACSLETASAMYSTPQKKCNTPKHKFTEEEDKKIRKGIEQFGEKWELIAKTIVERSARQCRERYKHFLRPGINFAPFTEEEDLLLAELFHKYGQRWSMMTQYLPDRTDIAIRNRFLLLKRNGLTKQQKPPATSEKFNDSETLNAKISPLDELFPGLEDFIFYSEDDI